MTQLKGMAQIISNSSVSPKVKEAIKLIISEVLGEANDVHIKTQELGNSFLADCRDRKLSPKTTKGYISHIKQLVELSEEFPPEPKVIQGFLANTNGTYNADAHYRTWHALGNYAKRQYGIPNFMDEVIRPRIPKQIMPTISSDELLRLGKLLNREAPPRDRAIVALFVDTGIRSGEACNLKRKDIGEDRIIVTGKTGYRVAPLSSITRELLLALPIHKDGYVFHGRLGKPLGSTGFYKVVHRYLRLAGYTGRQASPQILRRSLGRFWLLSGGDMKSLSLALGHASVATTDKAYTPLLEQDVIKIHHKHTPGRVFENASSQRVQELAATQPLER